MKNENTNFDELIDRTEVHTLKFDGEMLESIFGERTLWPSWVADMDFKSSENVSDALENRLGHGIFGYESDNQALPIAVSQWYESRHSWSLDANHIIFSPRTLNSLAVLINLLSNEGDGIIVQPPVFYDFKIIINGNNRRLIKNPLKLVDGIYQMDFDHLSSIAAEPNNRLMILCNPHNPIGRVWSSEDLKKLAEICALNEIFIISDEIHGDITFQTRYTPLASVSDMAAKNCATCISPIKSFNLAGVANSMIVIDDIEKRKQCKNWYSRLEVNKNNVFTSASMMAAYTEGELWLDQVIEYLRGNIQMLRSFLHQNIPMIKLIEPEGTYLVWLDFRLLGLDPNQLQEFLVKRAKIAANPGHWFGREGAGFVRINIACPRSVLEQGLKQLGQAVNYLVGSK